VVGRWVAGCLQSVRSGCGGFGIVRFSGLAGFSKGLVCCMGNRVFGMGGWLNTREGWEKFV
jgi:hypothetical protein